MRERSSQEIYEIIRQVRIRAKKYAHTPLGSDDAEGIGLLAAVEAWQRWDPELGDFLPWVMSRASWEMRSACREVYGTKTRHSLGFVASEDEIEAMLSPARDEYTDLPDQILGLKDRHRAALILRWAGYDLKEIGDYLGVCESRVTQIVTTAKRKLLI